MKQIILRMLQLIWGLILYAVGIVITINANIGYAPWDTFHIGLAKITGLSIGSISILVGIIIGILVILLGEKLGLGTILNMVLIGVFIDIIIASKLIPVNHNFLLGIVMVIIGLFIIAFASYFYIGSGFGAGPRDSLMVSLNRKTGLSIGICRGSIELLAVFIGWWLGGMIGVGTLLSAFFIGFCVQITFRLLKFEPAKIKHETLKQTYELLIQNRNS